MRRVYADIALINAVDFRNSRRHLIGEEVRRMCLNILGHTEHPRYAVLKMK